MNTLRLLKHVSDETDSTTAGSENLFTTSTTWFGDITSDPRQSKTISDSDKTTVTFVFML